LLLEQAPCAILAEAASWGTDGPCAFALPDAVALPGENIGDVRAMSSSNAKKNNLKTFQNVEINFQSKNLNNFKILNSQEIQLKI
jgi:hypothetical protein